MKSVLLLSLVFFSHLSLGAEACDLSSNGLMKYEQRILIAADLFKKHHDSHHLLKITEPLACLLEIQENGTGEIKYFANSFLRPIFGGAQIQGVPQDSRYQIIADELTKISSHSTQLLDRGIMAAHSRGAWGFYTLFCEQGDVEFCTSFLPDETRVQNESPLLAASSMILLRKAFYVLNGKQKQEVADRIKQIYRTIPLDNGLKRKVIDQIYSEIFAPPTPLSLLS